MKSHTRQVKLQNLLILTLLGVLMYVSQVIMAPLPNIEIVSLLMILTTRKFGYKVFISVYVFVGCEIFTYGLEMWAINYLYVWDVLILAVLIIRKVDNVIVYTLLSSIFGLTFDIFCSIPYFLTGGIAGGVAYIIKGVNFSFLHCYGNFITTILLYTPLTKVMNKVIK